MTKTFSAVVVLGFFAASCGPADLADGVDENGATVADAPEEATAATEQALCDGWGPWKRYPAYSTCTCGTAKAWGTTATTAGGTVDNAASGWSAGYNHTNKYRRVQGKCSRRIDGRTTTVTSPWTQVSSNTHVNCPAGYPDIVEARCEVH